MRALMRLWPLLLLALVCGCRAPAPEAAGGRAFAFERDTFAYANELVWEYAFDAQGNWTARRREPPPEYALHCFVMARAAKQFFVHARFDPDSPKAGPEDYRRLIRRVVSRSPRDVSPGSRKVVIPGYASLREFSAAQETLLKAECGGAWQSYMQRGHWRMIFPFSRRHQDGMAAALAENIRRNQAPVAHLVSFPGLSINHAVVVYGARENGGVVAFDVYDPNQPEAPTTLTFEKTTRRFEFPRNDYFHGGTVKVYEVYRRGLY